MENQLKDYSLLRHGRAYVKGHDKKGKKIYGFKETYRTKIGDFSPEEWREIVLQAIEDEGETDLLEDIKDYCREKCAWLHKEKDIEEYSMECLVDRAYLYWKDFKGGLQMAEEKIERTETVENAPAEMEFRLINPTEKGFLKHIEWNKQELEEAVKSKVAEYSGIEYTEETLKSAKKDRAELNKLLKAIEERRKKVKEIINKPYADFEKELKEVTALISDQVKEIDVQVKKFEDDQKEEKKKKIKVAYDESIGELAEILPFDRIFTQAYLNKTYKLENAIEEVKKRIEEVKTDLGTIDEVCGKYKLNAKDVYIRTLDLSKALAEEKRLRELEEKMEADRIQKEKEEEERKKAQEERAREEARKAEQKRLEEEQRRADEEEKRKSESQKPVAYVIAGGNREGESRDEPEPAVDPFIKQEEKSKPEKKVRTKFYAIGTMEQLKGLVAYMKENGIKYGKVE